MERDVCEFLMDVSIDELVSREVVSPYGRYGYVLQGRNVAALVRLMRDRGVTGLTSAEGNWRLGTDGTFSNPRPREFKSGAVGRLEHTGNVFRDQNVHINPHYDGNAR
ncbi:MAG: hypothetical protein F4X66_18885 [Chloroflexi bacterium]|nr:hypothetical protein [Chloroflexota bacterium]MYE38617.1 hypothetical protein [Chloroflexota bacterium]